jgi:hypothetical protein
VSLETAAPPKFGKESENLFQITHGWNKYPAPIVFIPFRAFRVSRYVYARGLRASFALALTPSNDVAGTGGFIKKQEEY